MELHTGIMLTIELNIDNNYFTSFRYHVKKYKWKKVFIILVDWNTFYLHHELYSNTIVWLVLILNSLCQINLQFLNFWNRELLSPQQ